MIKQLLLPFKQTGFSLFVLQSLGTFFFALLILLQPFIYNAIMLHQFRLTNYGTDISAPTVFSLTNQERTANGVANLQENAQLDAAAQAKAEDMFAKDYWAHNSPTGETPWDFIVAAGYHYSAAAENLAMDFDTSTDVINGWMNSPEHRTNMLNGTYTDVGIAVMNGTLTGEQTTLVVMELGHPAYFPAPTPVATPTTTPKPVATPPITAPPTHQAQTPVKSATVKPTAPSITAPKQTIVNPDPLISLSAFHATVVSVNWAQWATLLLTIVVLLLNYARKSYVWRKGKRVPWHTRWLRTHPMFQINLATCAGALMIGSSTGVFR